VIPYKKIIRDGVLTGLFVVPLYYILGYALRGIMLQLDSSYVYEPSWAFAVGLGLGNMILPMVARYNLEKKLNESRKRWDEIESIIEITEEIEVKECLRKKNP